MPRRYCATAAIKWASLGVFSALSELPEISTQMPTASMVSALVRAPAHQAGAPLGFSASIWRSPDYTSWRNSRRSNKNLMSAPASLARSSSCGFPLLLIRASRVRPSTPPLSHSIVLRAISRVPSFRYPPPRVCEQQRRGRRCPAQKVYRANQLKSRILGLMDSFACGSRGAALSDHRFATSTKQSKGARRGVNAPPQITRPACHRVIKAIPREFGRRLFLF